MRCFSVYLLVMKQTNFDFVTVANTQTQDSLLTVVILLIHPLRQPLSVQILIRRRRFCRYDSQLHGARTAFTHTRT